MVFVFFLVPRVGHALSEYLLSFVLGVWRPELENGHRKCDTGNPCTPAKKLTLPFRLQMFLTNLANWCSSGLQALSTTCREAMVLLP